MDGFGDNSDAFVDDPSEWEDTDWDGIGDNSDMFPFDGSEWLDFDGDGWGTTPTQTTTTTVGATLRMRFRSMYWSGSTLTATGTGDNEDFDDDNDGWSDSEDVFPLDPAENSDNDMDGVGDNEDQDDDNDGWSDVDEVSCGQSSPRWTVSRFPRTSMAMGYAILSMRMTTPMELKTRRTIFPWTRRSGWTVTRMVSETMPMRSLRMARSGNDSDADGVGDNSDVFPEDGSEWNDSDADVGDNSDVFPEDGSEWSDSDGDGVGDNSDVFIENPWEWSDSDGDGVGDNSDVFPERAD